jgi:hypothetical protein
MLRGGVRPGIVQRTERGHWRRGGRRGRM